MDLAIPEGVQDQPSTSAEQLMELSLSSCPDSDVEDPDIEDGASRNNISFAC